MENIFIDTSVYIQEGYIKGRTIKSLFDLAKKGVIRILLPQLTRIEIFRHMRKDTAREGLKKALDMLEKSFLPCLNEGEELMKQLKHILPTVPTYVEDLFHRDFLAHTIPVEIPDTFNLHDIIDKFEKLEYPFSEKKTQEFADAITLQMLEDWCKQENESCFLLSTDGDLQNYKGSRLTYKDYKEYNQEKMQQIIASSPQQAAVTQASGHSATQVLSMTTSLFSNPTLSSSFSLKKDEIEQEIQGWLADNLDNDVLYCMFLQVGEINNYSIDNITVEFDDLLTLIGMYDDIQAYECKVRLSANIAVEHPDYDTASFDWEDNRWYFIDDNMTTEIECNLTIPIVLNFDNTNEELTLESINNGKKLTDREIEDSFNITGSEPGY